MEIHPYISKRTYVLDADHNIVAEPDVMKWGAWLNAAVETEASVVAQEEAGGAWISTVFLGLDHNHMKDGEPILFETAVFRKDGTTFTRRYKDWTAARQGHEDLVYLACMCDPSRVGAVIADVERMAGDLSQPLPPDPVSE
jgi:hypothetical protein